MNISGCPCKLCEQGRRLRAICELLPPEDAAWLRAFGDEFLSVGMDADYYESIVKGDWPDAVEILARALERAKAKQEIPA